MKILHPDGRTKLFLQAGTDLIGKLEANDWISFGTIYDSDHLLLNSANWEAFTLLIDEMKAELSEEHG